jgi:membrane protease YdiL (CAAX protease family)
VKLIKKQKIVCYTIIIIGIIGMAFFELGQGMITSEFFEENGEWLCKTFSRLLGGIVCCAVMLLLVGSHLMFKYREGALKRLLVVLPCFAVAINNFPFLSVVMKEITFSANAIDVILYAIFCFSVGFFEEAAFRGCVFSLILDHKKPDRWSVLKASVISSAVFGIVHIVNLFAGASLGSVILQIGYSFLIGALCSVVLVKTSNIWCCVILHAVYNFAGGVLSEFGSGRIWTAPTVVLTVVVAVLVTVYTVVLWYNIKKEEIEYISNGAKLTYKGDAYANV